MAEQLQLPNDRCPRCGSVRLSVRFAAFWAVINDDGEPGSWQHHESRAGGTDARALGSIFDELQQYAQGTDA